MAVHRFSAPRSPNGSRFCLTRSSAHCIFRADPRLYLSQAALDEQLDAGGTVGTSLAKERLETDINGYLLAQRADEQTRLERLPLQQPNATRKSA
jgi:hypothetical protein